MRNPKLNISLSDFLEVTADILTQDAAKEIFKRASRLKPAVFLLKTSGPKADRVRKVLRKSDVDLFNQLLTQQRMIIGHQFMTIQHFDSDFATLKEVAADADEFCTLYGMNLLDGYSYYIREGINLMGKAYGLSKFKYYKSKLFDRKNREIKKLNDPDPDTTEKLYRSFLRVYNIKHTSEYYNSNIVDFIYITEVCRELEVRYDKYLTLQVDYFKNINKVPEPSWLHADAARERALKLKR